MISKHISLDDAIKSDTGKSGKIDNTPSEAALVYMRDVAEKCFEPMIEWYDKTITINSFYRCKELNTIVGGLTTSSHILGQAIDLTTESLTDNKLLFVWCAENLEFDELICEYYYSWIHISYVAGNNRNRILNEKLEEINYKTSLPLKNNRRMC